MTDGDALVEVARFNRLEQAELAKGLLAQEGIAAVVPDSGVLGVHPLLVGALGFVRLLVAVGDAERAQDLLDQAGLPDGPREDASGDMEAEALAAVPVDESTRAFLRRGRKPGGT